jgi:uncharacterized membrane protein (DUF4010 family)
MTVNEQTLIGLGAALGIGLLIGIERERRKGTGPQRALAGARTFTLAALSGAIAQAMNQPWLVLVGALLILALAAIGYWRSTSDDPGITTELALFVTYVLGVTAIEHPAVAAGCGVIVAGLLASRRFLHDFSIEVLSEVELRDALVFAGAALVVLPLLPNHPIDPIVGINPRRLWGLVVLFMALQAVGYIALRVFGTRLGLALSGFAAGFVSSTATIAALGTRARQDSSLLLACVSGAMFSTLTTVLLLGIVAMAVHMPMLKLVAPSLLCGLLAAALAAVLSLRRKSERSESHLPKGRAFSLLHGLGFATILTAITALVAFGNAQFGQLAVSISTAFAGFFDVHAATASVFALAAGDKLPPAQAVQPMLLAFTTNTLSKAVGAYFGGGWTYALRVWMGLAWVLAAMWLPYFWLT